jgi:hypothetical protein
MLSTVRAPEASLICLVDSAKYPAYAKKHTISLEDYMGDTQKA